MKGIILLITFFLIKLTGTLDLIRTNKKVDFLVEKSTFLMS